MWGWLVRAHAVGLARDGGVDPGAALGAELRRGPWAVGLDAGLYSASGGGVSALEVELGVGPRFELGPAAWLRLQADLRLGAVVHRWSYEEASGTRADALAVATARGRIPLTERLGVEAALSVGTTFRERRHELGDEVIWRRSAWRVGAGLGLVFVGN